MLRHILYITISNKISNYNYKIDDIKAAEADAAQNDLRETAKSADGYENKGAQEEDVEDKKEVIVSLVKLQEQLDEIQSNMAANNGRLDDTVLNKLLNIDILVFYKFSYVFSDGSSLASQVRVYLGSTAHVVS